jgi:hypothetical protein
MYTGMYVCKIFKENQLLNNIISIIFQNGQSCVAIGHYKFILKKRTIILLEIKIPGNNSFHLHFTHEENENQKSCKNYLIIHLGRTGHKI